MVLVRKRAISLLLLVTFTFYSSFLAPLTSTADTLSAFTPLQKTAAMVAIMASGVGIATAEAGQAMVDDLLAKASPAIVSSFTTVTNGAVTLSSDAWNWVKNWVQTGLSTWQDGQVKTFNTQSLYTSGPNPMTYATVGGSTWTIPITIGTVDYDAKVSQIGGVYDPFIPLYMKDTANQSYTVAPSISYDNGLGSYQYVYLITVWYGGSTVYKWESASGVSQSGDKIASHHITVNNDGTHYTLSVDGSVVYTSSTTTGLVFNKIGSFNATYPSEVDNFRYTGQSGGTVINNYNVKTADFPTNWDWTKSPGYDLSNRPITVPTVNGTGVATPADLVNSGSKPATLAVGEVQAGATTATDVGATSALLNEVTGFFNTLTDTSTSTAVDFSPLQVVAATLEKKFPFSIPWDLANQLSVFNVSPVAPTLHIHFPSTLGTSTGLDWDMSLQMFDPLAAGLRWILNIAMDIAFILGLRRLMPE